MQLRIISIGALAAHPLWNERAPVRTGHATTSLITTKDANILVDPGLPAQALTARLSERANLKPDDITHVFLTSFRPDVRRSLALFDRAEWLLHTEEREAVGVPLAARLKQLAGSDEPPDEKEVEALQQDIALLQRCQAAPDSLADRVDLFPLPGVSPGTCGLILEDLRHTVVICGDAIPTVEHLEQGKLLPGAMDLDKAKASFEEAVEIADLLVLGRDNMVVNPTKRPF